MFQGPMSPWEDVIFSDECKFALKNNPRPQTVENQIADHPDVYIPTFSNYLSMMMVWGCIWPDGVWRLAIWAQSVDSDYQVGIMEKNLKPSVEMMYGDPDHPLMIIHQDNVPSHAFKNLEIFPAKRRDVVILACSKPRHKYPWKPLEFHEICS